MKKALLMKLTFLKRSLLSAVCALVVASGFVWDWAWVFSLVGLVSTLGLLACSEKLSTKSFIWQCVIFGYVFLGVVLNWIYGIHTTELIGDTPLAVVFLVLTFVLMVGVLTMGFVLMGALYRRLKISTSNKTILYIPALWAIGEWFRSVFFSIMSMGDGGSVGPYWNFGSLGFVAVQTPLKYATRIVGLYGTSLLFVLIAVIIYKLIQRRYRYGYLLFIPIACSVLGWGVYRTSNGQSLSVGTVAINGEKDTGYEAVLDSKLKTAPQIDTLVLPEYSYYFNDSDGTGNSRTLPVDIPLAIDSSSRRQPSGIENMVSFYDKDAKVIQTYQKSFLIPGGEFIPYAYHIILFYSGNTSLVNQFHNEKAVERAPEKEQAFEYRGVSYGALACSGAIAPSLYSRLTNGGAEVLTNSASISTLGVSDAYYRQASQMSVFIATANARPFVQSARGGPSYVLDKDGNILTRIASTPDSDVTSSVIQTNSKKTPYVVLGEWLLYLSFGAIALRLIILREKSKKKIMKKRKK